MSKWGIFDTPGGKRIRDVAGTRGRYAVSSAGDVYSVVQGIPFEMTKIDGRWVHLYRNGACAKVLVSYLVARTFIPNPELRPFVVHRDGNPRNNAVENLMWSETKENNRKNAKSK